uniref:Pepsin inhibitor-3-like repeated domain-containing protein n=1 Tax=Acrobeloides nanus TaxID=290746 RepID=A0A914DK63_9BILA
MRLCYQVLLFVGIILISESAPLTSYSKVSSVQISSTNNPACKVVGDGLYIDGVKQRDVDNREREEFDRYLTELKRYSDKILSGQSVTDLNLPFPPQQPSFCKTSKTATYTFDDCKVTNNKLYIRNIFIRDLSHYDQDQLKRFEEQMADYSAKRSTQSPEAPSFCTTSGRIY